MQGVPDKAGLSRTDDYQTPGDGSAQQTNVRIKHESAYGQFSCGEILATMGIPARGTVFLSTEWHVPRR